MAFQLNDNEKPSMGTQVVQLSLVLVVVGVVAYLVLAFIKAFIYWIIGVLGIAVLIINRKLVMQLVQYIRGLYQKNLYMGLGATVGAFLAFTPFMAFLFVKTIWDFRKSDFIPSNRQKTPAASPQVPPTEDVSHIEIPNLPKNDTTLQ